MAKVNANIYAKQFSFKVAKDLRAGSLRLDQFLALQFPSVSLTRLRRAIDDGDALVNGRASRVGWGLDPGDTVTIMIDADQPTSATPQDIPLSVIFEDADLLVINKPVGILSHPSNSEKSGTVMNAVAFHLLKTASVGNGAAYRPALLHRLDRDTSGVLALAKTERASRIVSKAFRNRRVSKSYLALVCGVLDQPQGEIAAPIGRNAETWPRWRIDEGGQPAQTKYQVIERFAAHSLIQLEPLTGRTHQLRIHCAYLGHPIMGDSVYKAMSVCDNSQIKGLQLGHQLLHASTLSFPHPSREELLKFVAAPPQHFEQVLNHLRGNSG